jgi:histone deacetylase 8
MNSKNIAFIYSNLIVHQLKKIEQIKNRSNLVISLIHAYGLFDRFDVLSPIEADDKHLALFHSKYYIEALKHLNDADSIKNEDVDEFGFEYDCPLIDKVYEFCRLVAGSSITAAHALLSGKYNYAINWFGGWHHAKRDKASGYCYVNDIVLCILTLRKKFSRILYIDMDLHHGDGKLKE